MQAVNSLVAGAIKARARERDLGFLAQERRVVGEAYASSPAQACVAVMICAAFLTDISEAQLRPERALAHELGINGDVFGAGQRLAERGESAGIGDDFHGPRFYRKSFGAGRHVQMAGIARTTFV